MFDTHCEIKHFYSSSARMEVEGVAQLVVGNPILANMKEQVNL
ncbi:hypothetical protein [Enterococcus avium]|nr:hypothetical protein [Enterococcus avium]